MSESKTKPSISLTTTEEGRVHLSGDLSFQTVPDFFSSHRDIFKPGMNNLDVDLDGIHRADSAGIALLVEWQRQAQRQNCSIHFHNIPRQLLAIARLSGVEAILSLSSNAAG